MERYSVVNRPSRKINIGGLELGGDAPIRVQSMCATKTTDVSATLKQIALLQQAGADFVRVAVDSKRDVDALSAIRKETDARLVVDLQENFKLAKDVAPYVQKIRYNPGHLYHHFQKQSVEDKVKFLVDICGEYNLGMRIGVNFGSLDPSDKAQANDSLSCAVDTAIRHSELVEKFGFFNFVVSIKSSDPYQVVKAYKKFAAVKPAVPLHLGVTEAGMLPDGEIKTRVAFEHLLACGIGDTIRVSLTLPDREKDKEVIIGRKIIDDVKNNRFINPPKGFGSGLNVVSCPSCSRVENKRFVKLAQDIRSAVQFAKEHDITIAVMGCRVNGPGETDHADLGVWCGPKYVNLKRGEELIGRFGYEEVIDRLIEELHNLIRERQELKARVVI